MSGFPQQSTQCQILFNIFRSDLDDRSECILPRFAYDTKLGAERDMLEGRTAIQTLTGWKMPSTRTVGALTKSCTWDGIIPAVVQSRV